MTPEDREELAKLLETPDPPDLLNLYGEPRGRRVTQEGAESRQDDYAWWLPVAYAVHQKDMKERQYDYRHG